MKILLANDNPMAIRDMANMLMHKCYKLISLSYDGAEAWNNILLLRPDLVILNYNMPGINGIEIAERILEEQRDIKIVLLAKDKQESMRHKAMSAGVHGYLLEDFAMTEMAECLQSISLGMTYYSPYCWKAPVAMRF